jgi:hypothetical protein
MFHVCVQKFDVNFYKILGTRQAAGIASPCLLRSHAQQEVCPRTLNEKLDWMSKALAQRGVRAERWNQTASQAAFACNSPSVLNQGECG